MKILKKDQSFISITAYVHNSREELRTFIPFIHSYLEDHFINYEMIFVDDYSIDDSVIIIEDLSKKLNINKKVTIITMSYYQGTELSMTAAIDLSIGDLIIEFENLNIIYDYDTLHKVYTTVLEGFDIVSSVPKNKIPLQTRLFYSLFNILNSSGNLLYKETFRIISRRAINRVKSLNSSIQYRKVLYNTSGLKNNRVFYEIIKSKKIRFNSEVLKKRKSMAIDVLMIYSKISILFSSTISVLINALTIILLFLKVSSIDKEIGLNYEGIHVLFMIILSSFSILFTITIKYLFMLINAQFNNSKYVIESIRKVI